MSARTIDKGVPLPNPKNGSGLAATMRALEVGDSFLYPIAKRGGIASTADRVRIKITTRQEGDMVRVWRIA